METINPVLFYITSLILIFSSIMTILSKKIMHSVFYALIAFFITGLIFFSLNAPFNGCIQISIYAIALSIIFAIAITLSDCKDEKETTIKPKNIIITISGIIIFCSVLIMINETAKYDSVIHTYLSSPHLLTTADNIKQLASELLLNNIYAFELLGIYLLSTLTGISVLFVFKGGR